MLAGVSSHDYAVLRWEVLHRDQSLQERTHLLNAALCLVEVTIGSTLALLTAAPCLLQAAEQKGLLVSC